MTDQVKDRMREVKSILVSQPKPKDENSPYFKLAEKYNLTIDFRPFIQVDPVSIKEFRQQKIDILNHTAIIFTSRNAVDHFFDICEKLKIEMPADMKYFCISEQTANYLQKYIVIRKRKIFTGHRTAAELIEILKKHNKDNDEVWSSITTNQGSISHLDFLTEHEKDVFKTAFELDQKWIVELGADRTPYVSQAQSINIFLIFFMFFISRQQIIIILTQLFIAY